MTINELISKLMDCVDEKFRDFAQVKVSGTGIVETEDEDLYVGVIGAVDDVKYQIQLITF